jgi:hypothetical protein
VCSRRHEPAAIWRLTRGFQERSLLFSFRFCTSTTVVGPFTINRDNCIVIVLRWSCPCRREIPWKSISSYKPRSCWKRSRIEFWCLVKIVKFDSLIMIICNAYLLLYDWVPSNNCMNNLSDCTIDNDRITQKGNVYY